MGKEIVVNARGLETRIAILKNRKLVEILFERDFSEQIIGNIYKGRVENVLPGMQAAFINVGLEKNVFLHAKDATPLVSDPDKSRIQDVLQPGQEILIQITKEALGTKGPRGTCKLNIPGRYLVLMGSKNHVGVSRRIEDGEERGRLRKLAKSILPEDKGVIVRTLAAYKSDHEIKNDLKFLIKLWNNIQQEAENCKAPCLVYGALNLIKKVVRDKFTPEVDKLILDTRHEYNQVEKLVNHVSPELKTKVYHYNHYKPIFDHYNIEAEIKGLLERKVSLNCGGYIIIDTTEALTAIDVNTGSYVGKDNLEDTVFKTNFEAAKEIAKQLRLRDIGGIIIIDFIDMKDDEDQKEVLMLLEEELAKDKTRTSILGLTQLGLVEMTRKNERERVGQYLQQDCPYCEGKGKILSEDTIFLEKIREIRELFWQEKAEAVLLELHPKIAARLIGLGGKKLKQLEQELKRQIYIKGNAELHLEEMKVLKLGSKSEIEDIALPVEVGERISVKIEEKHLNNPQDGIARLDGYIIDIINGGLEVGNKVEVEIIEITKTYAEGKIIRSLD